MDLAPRRLVVTVDVFDLDRFQSLFWWISLLGTTNPSGIGIAAVQVFQSLFWWISLLGADSRDVMSQPPLPFQSLFWWISLLGVWNGAILDIMGYQFQSLFWWISLLGITLPP